MRVAVIGAGVAGLSCARQLHAHAVDVVVFEKSRGFGGRAATRRLGPYTFDTGATSLTPQGKSIFDVVTQQLDASELVQVEKPIYYHVNGRVSGKSSGVNGGRYCYTKGMSTLGKLLASGLDVRLETLIEKVTPNGGKWDINGEQFDKVVFAAPLEQTSAILLASGIERKFVAVSYRKCLSVLFGFAHAKDWPFHALLDPEQRHPATWLSIESVKVPGHRAPEGHSAVVVQMSPSYSRLNFENEEKEIVGDSLVYVHKLLGEDMGQPVIADVKRWRFSHPESVLDFANLNKGHDNYVICGDFTHGPRIEFAYESGLAAAGKILG